MKRKASLLRSAALAAALSVALVSAAPLILFDNAAYASGRDDDNSGPGSGGDDDWDDNSGPGSGDDWAGDLDWHDYGDDDQDNSGPGSGDDDWDDDHDNSGSGSGGDVWDDDDQDNSGSGSGGDDVDDNSGHGGGDDADHNQLNGGEAGGAVEQHAIYSVEYDSHGDEYLPGEIVFVGTANDLAIALNLGFSERSVQNLNSGGIMARLTLPPRVEMDAALAMLAQAAPDTIATPNNIYRSAQTSRTNPERTRVRRAARTRGVMGVIDTGVDARALSDGVISQRAFAGPQPVAREHGSTVAAIAVSRGIRVHVADVFGQTSDGALAASAERIAAAVDWMIANRVAVVNISIEGPDNAILAEMIRRAEQRGHIIVAAAGNSGPAARPSYPAAFDGVLAVTAIDETGRPYIRANRGSYIDFAAQGVNMRVERGTTSERVSGTSFAAPIIAAEAAAHLHTPSPTESARVVASLRARAEDLGEPGRDNIFGWGALRD